MNVKKQNPILDLIAGSNNQRGVGWSKAGKQVLQGLISMHINGNCVSSTTRFGGPFISSLSSGPDSGMEGFGVVRGVLKRMDQQCSLWMAAHTQTSQPQAVKRHQYVFKKACLKKQQLNNIQPSIHLQPLI